MSTRGAIKSRSISTAALRGYSPVLAPGTFHQTAEEFSPEKVYFVTFRKPRKNPRPNQSPWLVIDIVTPASSRKSARSQAEAIAKEEFPGFVYVGVN
jgi:hypothetical protein